jgi:hypothetical protein
MGFWEFAIITTLMTVFFPWSLLFCLFFYGMEGTKFLVIAIFHDLLKTALAIISILVPLIFFIFLIVLFFAN